MHKNNRRFKNYLLSAFLTASASPAFAAGGFTIMYGNKSLEADNWRPVESQQEAGFSIEFQGPGWPVTAIASYLTSEGSATAYGPGYTLRIKGNTTEIGLGVRKYLAENRIRPFIEAGLMRVTAKLSAEVTGYYSGTASDSDSGNGFWLGAGINTLLSDAWSIGFLGRISTADVTLGGLNGEAGGKHFNFTATYHFD